MALSDAKVRNAKAQAKPYKIYDGEGMYLFVTVTGVKSWRFKYRFGGKEKLLTLGMYPEVKLADARQRRSLARKSLADGNDPASVKKEAKRQAIIESKNSFEVVSREWHEKRKHKWNPETAELVIKRLEQHVFPQLGRRPIADIDAAECLDLLQKMEKKGILETTRRIIQITSKVFTFAIATKRARNNPVAGLGDAIATPQVKHRAYIKPDELPDFFKRLAAAPMSLLTKFGLRLILLTLLRSSELREGRWVEVDFKTAQWRIPGERMKMKTPHIVPLSRQAVTVLKEIKKISGESEFIFPNQVNDKKMMSENTLLYALYDMHYYLHATVHGFRSTGSTVLNEKGFHPDWIERQLAHEERDSVRAAYNYAQYLPERRKMMQWWADYLDKAAKKKTRSRVPR